MIVLPIAAPDTMNLYLDISASNKFATTALIICDKPIPKSNPTTIEPIPMMIVSINKIIDILPLLIPSVIYRANSLCRRFIMNLLAYTMSKPNIIETKTLAKESPALTALETADGSRSNSINATCPLIALNT